MKDYFKGIGNPVFRAGLNKKIIRNIKSTNLDNLENYFFEKYYIDTCFMGDKAIGYCNYLVVNILNGISGKIAIGQYSPPIIRSYIIKPDVHTEGKNFCIFDDALVFTNQPPFPRGSIFFSKVASIESINENSDKKFKDKISSSPHFLSDILHEWLHALHLKLLIHKYGLKFKDVCTLLKTKALTVGENEIVFDILGEYSTRPKNQYMEVFAETFTKFICDALSGDELIKNPIELFKNSPKEFQTIVRKTIDLEI